MPSIISVTIGCFNSNSKYSEEGCSLEGISGSDGVGGMAMIPNRHSDGVGGWDGICLKKEQSAHYVVVRICKSKVKLKV